MQPYANLGGDSNVVAYELGEGFIRVQFRDASVYLYTASSAGSSHIERMHTLARQGQGLNGYIQRYVRKAYVRRER